MVFYVNQASNLFTRALGVNSTVSGLAVKARDSLKLDVWFHDGGGSPASLAVDSELVFAIKASEASAATLYAIANVWDLIEEGHYQASLNLNTAAVVDGIGDLARLSAVGELSWNEGDGWESSNTLAVTIQNDVYKGVEGTPLELETPEEWMTATRTLAEGGPSGSISVGGDLNDGTDPVVFPDLVFATSAPTYTLYTDDGLTDFEFGVHYAFYVYADSLRLVKFVDLAVVASWEAPYVADFSEAVWSAELPVTGYPEVLMPVSPTHIGQWCRVETATADVYDWWQWNGDTWVFVRTDGVVNAPISVTTNTAKKALAGVFVGALCVITGEAGRVEQYLGDLSGGAETNDQNWAVVDNPSFELIIYHSSIGNNPTINGVECPPYTNTSCGWVVPLKPITSVRGASSYAMYVVTVTVGGVATNHSGVTYHSNIDKILTRNPQYGTGMEFRNGIFPPRSSVNIQL